MGHLSSYKIFDTLQVDVIVHVGENLALRAGTLTYHITEENTNVIIGSVVGVVAVIIIAAVIGKKVKALNQQCASLYLNVVFIRKGLSVT